MHWKINHIHFIGIGGIGMSGLAGLLHNLGFRVSGSDIAESENTLHLRKLGVAVTIGHHPDNIGSADVVVYSSAIRQDNPELLAARNSTAPLIPRAEMLAELMRMKYGIAIAGTHGKTTTTSMIATVLAEGGLDPTAVIGGRLASFGSNAWLGQGDFLVAEADESDGSFLQLSPAIAVVTTLDEEHMDYYGSLDRLKAAFLDFINKVPFYGTAVICLDQGNIQALVPDIRKRYISYGLISRTDLTASAIEAAGLQSSFEVIWKEQKLGRMVLNVPGIHNVYNSLAATAVGLDLGLSFDTIREGLAAFRGADRRFQIKARVNNTYVVDDYGHHPAEIQATLATARSVLATEAEGAVTGRRLIVIFQPHRYTRTRDLLAEFATAFYQSDTLIITDIYPAGERPIEGINALAMAEGVRQSGHTDVHYIPDKDEIPALIGHMVRPGDMILTLGAGDIWKLDSRIVALVEEKFS
ncbi:MAG: UDP-N-acetylmuramate--L-alanine ligase [bacterium]